MREKWSYRFEPAWDSVTSVATDMSTDDNDGEE